MKSQLRGREKLEQYFKKGLYVFHGSDRKLSELEPRQQTSFNKKSRKMEPDGRPAICATTNFEVSIFRSLVNVHTCKKVGNKYGSSFGFNNENKLFLKATLSTIKFLNKIKPVGYVHVFKKEDFEEYPKHKFEYRVYKNIQPIDIVMVKVDDLPKNIDILT